MWTGRLEHLIDQSDYATAEAPPTIDETIDFAKEPSDEYALGGISSTRTHMVSFVKLRDVAHRILVQSEEFQRLFGDLK